MADSAAFYRVLNIMVEQPIYIILMAVGVFTITAAIKKYIPFIKKNELTYIVPFVLGELAVLIYSAICGLPIWSNLGGIAMNGVYVGLLSGVIYQLYKGVKDIGTSIILGDEKAMTMFAELKTKLGSSLDALTYSKKLKTLKFDNLVEVVDVLRGSGIREDQLINMANNLTVISNTIDDKIASNPKTVAKALAKEEKQANKLNSDDVVMTKEEKSVTKSEAKAEKSATKLEAKAEKSAIKLEATKNKKLVKIEKAQIKLNTKQSTLKEQEDLVLSNGEQEDLVLSNEEQENIMLPNLEQAIEGVNVDEYFNQNS